MSRSSLQGSHFIPNIPILKSLFLRFQELTKCRRRLAYLLSSLPNEVDIVSLVKKAVANTTAGAPDDGAASGVMIMELACAHHLLLTCGCW